MSKSLRGKILIAGHRLKDPNFFKSVVLIVEHGDEGAMGLVINRPSTVTVSNALAEHFDMPDIEELIYVGGPVEPQALFILHTAEELGVGEPSVIPGLFVGSSAEDFESAVRAAGASDGEIQFRIFSGCTGWSPGQLESEIARSDWLIFPAQPEFIFHTDPYAVWELLVQRVYESHRILPHDCPNPEWN